MATATITPDHDTILAEIFIAAPPERIFAAITDPAQMPLWWGQQGMYRITEWKNELRRGGKWSSVGVSVDGSSFRVDGEYLEVDPPRRLVHTWIANWTGPLKTVVHWHLDPHFDPVARKTGTLVKIRHQGFAANPPAAASHTEGWKRVLGWLEGYMERGDTVDTRQK
jgi:uncharacterized protein YndB with AHSA1/START domain